MIFYAFPEEAMHLKLGEVSSGRPQPQGDDLLVFGAAEVKCYSGISRKRLDGQLERHLLRLGGGLQFRDPPGRTIERECAPSQVWYAVPDGETLHVVCAEDRPLRAVRRPDGSRTFNVVWVDAGLRSLIRLTIGPRPSASTAAHRSPKVFDSVLPYDEGQLEEIGSAMAYYTLGAMADQPDVDLSGPEWSSNLERALECASTGLSRRQLARRERILSRLR